MKKRMIIKTIRRIYLVKLIPAVFFLIFTVFLINKYPFQEVLFPKHLDNINSIWDEYKSGQEFLEITVPTMYYTGYDEIRNQVKVGSYYYSFLDETCVFFLIKSEGSSLPKTELTNITIRTKRIKDDEKIEMLLNKYSKDLFWNKADLANVSADFIISEPDSFDKHLHLALLLLILGDMYSIATLMVCTCFLITPYRSPICRHLGKGKEAKKELDLVESECMESSNFSCGDIWISNNYLIELTKFKVTIIPLEQVMWVYKHSSLSYFSGISYKIVMYLTSGKIKIKNKQNLEVDIILDYISKKKSSILIGYSKENETIVKEQIRNRKMIWVNLKEG